MFFHLQDILYLAEHRKEMHIMKWVDYIALTLTIIGAVVWGLIGLFQFNLVSSLFGESSFFTRLRMPWLKEVTMILSARPELSTSSRMRSA